jgi:sodium/proton antiporter, NhaD family (TC 2.A.62)
MAKLLLLLALLPFGVFASGDSSQILDLTDHWVGYTALSLFVVAYIFVMVEEFHPTLENLNPSFLVAGSDLGLDRLARMLKMVLRMQQRWRFDIIY